ncbi:MAG TPA: nucleoside hydrolase, partial [Caulobacteraceae bacterium]|nr:nucleoside hydrolase [Caulobacteraceae bacterium]
AAASPWPLAQRLARAAGPYMAFQATTWGGDGCRPHDAVAAAALVWPDLFRFEPAAIQLRPEARGRLAREDGPPNAEVCVEVDAPEVTRRLLEAVFPATAAPVTPS